MPSKKLRGKQLKTFRSAVARLKSMGLVSKRVDARKQKPTRYMREQVEKRFADVLAGKAAAVKVPKRKDANKFEGTFDYKGKRVIVPIEKGARKPHFNKDGSITGTVEFGGRKAKRVYSGVSAESVKKLKKQKNIRYTIPFAHGGFLSFDSIEALEATLYEYENKTVRPYKNIRQYVLIDEFEESEGRNTEFE